MQTDKTQILERIAYAFSDHSFFERNLLATVDTDEPASVDPERSTAEARATFEIEAPKIPGAYHDLVVALAREEVVTGRKLTAPADLETAIAMAWEMARTRLDHVLENATSPEEDRIAARIETWARAIAVSRALDRDGRDHSLLFHPGSERFVVHLTGKADVPDIDCETGLPTRIEPGSPEFADEEDALAYASDVLDLDVQEILRVAEEPQHLDSRGGLALFSEPWREIGHAVSVGSRTGYFVWQRGEDRCFAVTKTPDAPAPSAGGYPSLDSLLRLKGCAGMTRTDEPAPAFR